MTNTTRAVFLATIAALAIGLMMAKSQTQAMQNKLNEMSAGQPAQPSH